MLMVTLTYFAGKSDVLHWVLCVQSRANVYTVVHQYKIRPMD